MNCAAICVNIYKKAQKGQKKTPADGKPFTGGAFLFRGQISFTVEQFGDQHRAAAVGAAVAHHGEEAAVLKDSMLRRSIRDSVACKYWRIVALQQKRQTLSETSAFLDSLSKDLSSARSAGLRSFIYSSLYSLISS